MKKEKSKPISDDELDGMLEDASREAEKRGESDLKPENDRRDLIRRIRVSRLALQMLIPKRLEHMRLTKLQRIWQRTIRRARKQGIIE